MGDGLLSVGQHGDGVGRAGHFHRVGGVAPVYLCPDEREQAAARRDAAVEWTAGQTRRDGLESVVGIGCRRDAARTAPASCGTFIKARWPNVRIMWMGHASLSLVNRGESSADNE